MNMHVPALQRSLSDIVAEYDAKRAGVPDALAAFEAAGTTLKSAATIEGVWGDVRIETGHVIARELEMCLLKSAWKHVYSGLNIDRIASANDKQRFKMAMEKPAPFTIDNIRATFGDFIINPRGNILRGLAEVFCDLDPSFKSHEKVKIGVKGLPKRIIVRNVTDYGWGRDKLISVINALASLQGKPLVTHREMVALYENESALLVSTTLEKNRTWDKPEHVPGRGIRLRRFDNGNGHLFFEPDTLRDINLGLAEYYGDVLPDAPDPDAKPQASTAVSKDLQFYPTPMAIAKLMVEETGIRAGDRVLDPNCGTGALLVAARKAGAEVEGVEVDQGRALATRALGITCLLGNFLAWNASNLNYDVVLMNPPFYGKHYAKHVEHAKKFLRPGGQLAAIVPATARYDHGLLTDGRWQDLPVGSFSESGTNINTCIYFWRAPR